VTCHPGGKKKAESDGLFCGVWWAQTKSRGFRPQEWRPGGGCGGSDEASLRGQFSRSKSLTPPRLCPAKMRRGRARAPSHPPTPFAPPPRPPAPRAAAPRLPRSAWPVQGGMLEPAPPVWTCWRVVGEKNWWVGRELPWHRRRRRGIEASVGRRPR
jgi:hypothetical protein